MLDPHGSHLYSPTTLHPCKWDLLIKSLIKAPGLNAPKPRSGAEQAGDGFWSLDATG